MTARSRFGQSRPRFGFLGVGWIGRHRMEAIARSEVAEIVAVCDPSPEAAAAAAALAPGARVADSFDALLADRLDGLVIATPSAAHAEQSIRALDAGVAVFCQKPLGRTGAETAAVVDAARRADRLLGVDFSYRYVEGVRRIAEIVGRGELGRIYAVNLVFHNAYGPDKPWFNDPTLAGGGCVMDLGIHLVDLALWMLRPSGARVRAVVSQLFAHGEPLRDRRSQVEDFGAAQLELDSGAVVQLACSWRLPAGRDCVIEAAFFGTEGGAALRNVNGSFYDFVAERYRGTATERLAEPPDAWGGRAAVDWARRLAAGARFDAGIDEVVEVARVLDGIYGA